MRRSSPLFTIKLLASQPGSPPKGLDACREARRSAQVALFKGKGLTLVVVLVLVVVVLGEVTAVAVVVVLVTGGEGAEEGVIIAAKGGVADGVVVAVVGDTEHA